MPASHAMRYVHTNLVAMDWKRLAGFYERVFGCVPAGPERDLSGPWLERATGVKDAHLRGAHLRLPGAGPAGPTLEIFQYDQVLDAGARAANRAGFGHLAFAVDSVERVREAVLQADGQSIGETVTIAVPGAGDLTFAYVADPEGNILELQKWADETETRRGLEPVWRGRSVTDVTVLVGLIGVFLYIIAFSPMPPRGETVVAIVRRLLFQT